MLPVLVCAEGFLLSHTSEVVDIPDQSAVDAFLPELQPARRLGARSRAGRARSPRCPSRTTTPPFQRNVADAMDEARGLVEAVAAEFTSHFGRRKVGALEIAGNPAADTALVTIGTIGDSALELLDDDDNLLLVRVHAYRPFPAAELAAALAGVSYVSVVDRAPAFGSLGPLGADVRSLDLPHAKAATNFVGGLGGTEVTPRRCAGRSHQTRSTAPSARARARLHPGGGLAMAAWLDEIVSEEQLLHPGHAACAGCAPAINVRHVLGAPGRGDAGVEDRPRHPRVVLDDHRRHLARQRVRRHRPPDAVRLRGGRGVRRSRPRCGCAGRRTRRWSSGAETARPATSASPASPRPPSGTRTSSTSSTTTRRT